MSRKPCKRHVQLTLDQARKPTGRGGWRPGAGRPKGRRTVERIRREPVAERYPQHVTMRIAVGVPALRNGPFVPLIRDCIAESHRETFRVVEFNIESNHLHLIIETASSAARASGMKGLEGRIAKRINAVAGRAGKVFADRYHARALKTPREVRHALRYVLNNARHHDPHVSFAFGDSWIDPCSSAPWFDGWARPIDTTVRWNRDLVQQPAPTVKARSWLLSIGWRRHGAIDFDEVPGPRSERDHWD